MTTQTNGLCEKPAVRPNDARFSSGPCKKHPGWDLANLNTHNLGRSHRASEPKSRLNAAITRSAELLGLPPPPEVAFDEAEMSPMARSFYSDSKRVRNDRIKDELGVELAYPDYKTGLAALLEAEKG